MLKLLLAIINLAIIASATSDGEAPVPSRFNFTAITASNGKSMFECWQLDSPIITSDQPGVVGAAQFQLGDFSSGSYSKLPAHFAGTPHPAPKPQWAVFLSGDVNLTIADPHQEYIIRAGDNAILFAEDTADKSADGHISGTLDQPLVGLQIPTPDGEVPGHTVLHAGGCQPDKLQL